MHFGWRDQTTCFRCLDFQRVTSLRTRFKLAFKFDQECFRGGEFVGRIGQCQLAMTQSFDEFPLCLDTSLCFDKFVLDIRD